MGMLLNSLLQRFFMMLFCFLLFVYIYMKFQNAFYSSVYKEFVFLQFWCRPLSKILILFNAFWVLFPFWMPGAISSFSSFSVFHAQL